MRIRQVVIHGKGKVSLDDAEIPDGARPGEILVETEATFISAGTELSGYQGLNPGLPKPGPPDYPLTPGYLNVGRVLIVGDNVDEFGAGDRVFSFARHASHHHAAIGGGGVVVAVPEEIDSHAAAASWLAGIALTSVQASDVSLNDWVAVFGLGLVGNLAAQLFRLSGARVIGIDPVAFRRRLAREVGIEHTAGGSNEAVAGYIRELCGPDGAGITVEAVGHSRAAEQAAELTAPHGELILLGTQRADYQSDLTHLMRQIHWKWLDVKGAQVWRIPSQPVRGVKHSSYGNALLIFDLLRSGRLEIENLISHRMRPAEIARAYELLLNGKHECSGVAIDWTR